MTDQQHRTRNRHKVTSYTIAVAQIIDMAMAGKRPRWTRAKLSEATKIEQSAVSRLLKPDRPMLVEELDRICRALGLNTCEVMDEAYHQARPAGLDVTDTGDAAPVASMKRKRDRTPPP